MKNIIVPIDFSIQSENALRVAASLARKHGSKIYALHMLELNEAYITPVIKHYKVFSEVNEVAAANNADIVIMGSHGTDGLLEIFIGSNTEKVVRNSEIPVLVIKHGEKEFSPKTMVLACDLDEENIHAYQRAKYIAAQFSAQLHVLYVNTPGDNFLSTEDINDKVTKFSKILGPEFLDVKIYNDYTVEKGVLNYAESQNIDVIGIPTHGRKGLSHFFMGSIGEDIANHSSIPVITFKI